MTRHFSLIALAAAGLAACGTNNDSTDPYATGVSLEASRDAGTRPHGVYTLTNQVSGNAVAIFHRADDGTLTPAGTVPTGGAGTGTGLGSQSAVILNQNGSRLLAVNAGSNDVSVFTVSAAGLTLASRTPSGGSQPTSVTVSGNLVYVLNAGGEGNISGFTLDATGGLTPIPGAIRPLSGTDVAAAQVSFSPDGRRLVVSERATNLLLVYPVDASGVAGEPTAFASPGATPFGFTFGSRGLLFVTEAAGSASSYVLNRRGELRLVSGAVPALQGAPCWAVVTTDGRFGFTGNGAGSVSAFAIAADGSIRLLGPDGAAAVIPDGVNDLALSQNSKYLYALGVGDAPAVHGFRIEPNGQLAPLGAVGGLPAGSRGLAAF